MIGLFVLCVTVIEGMGNSWLSLGVIDGYRASAVLGAALFFVRALAPLSPVVAAAPLRPDWALSVTKSNPGPPRGSGPGRARRD